ncbi:MAG: endonuclease domain-containing protein [Bacteroidia bacterium]
MIRINNLSKLKEKRRHLRKNLTPAEATLWRILKNSQLEGRKFRRQHSVGNYILDFYCPAERLAIELDGAHHFTEAGLIYDKKRTEYIETLGITIMRFENIFVFERIDYVIDEIKKHFKK